MKKSLLTFFIIQSLFAFCQTNESYTPLIQNIYGRTTQSLNGQWNRLVDPLESGYYDYRKRPNPNGFF
ncbi:MAG TPA: hypothetical protein VIK55_02340 [Paludibacter sp.]